MKKGSIIEVKIEDIEFPAKGIGYVNGLKMLFQVKLLKGELVKKEENTLK